MRRRRLLIGIALAAALGSALTARRLGAERRCPLGHGPVTCNLGRCANCGGAPASGDHVLCSRCADRLARCRDCGRSLAAARYGMNCRYSFQRES